MSESSLVTRHVFVFIEIFAREGGIQSYVKDLLQAYIKISEESNSPYCAEVFLLRDDPECNNPYEREGVQFHYFKTFPAWWGRIKLMGALLTCLYQRRPQHVICGHVKLAPLIKILCKPLGIAYTVSTHGKEVWSPLPTLQRSALQTASKIWTVSRYSRDRASKSNNIPQDKFHLLSCTVDGERFSLGEKPLHLLQKYNLQDAKVLMTVARLWSGDPYKGVDMTILALPKILTIFPEVKYLAIGRGDDLPRLEKLAADVGVSDQVIFAGFVATEDLADYYRVADAYIMPSQEGFGIVYLEAMISGLPVLAGDADGSADPLQDGKLGWRVPYRDVEAVADACIEILQGITNKTDMRCDGLWLREQTLAKFGKETLVPRLKRLLVIDN